MNYDETDYESIQDAPNRSLRGTMDSLEHLKSDKALMMIHGATNALLYLAFQDTLYKVAWVWYVGLELRSIHSKQLKR